MLKKYLIQRSSAILFYVSLLMFAAGLFLCVPFFVGIAYDHYIPCARLAAAFLLPGVALSVLALIGTLVGAPETITLKDAMFICTAAWILFSLVGAIPFFILTTLPPEDAFFESVSGITTTGFTMFADIAHQPYSILFWRSFSQWLGGIGILSVFLLIGYKGGAATNKLFYAEGHKITTGNPGQGPFQRALGFIAVYGITSIVLFIILMALDLNFFDALNHTLTTVSTGGFSIYDDSIGHYAAAGVPHALFIEIVIMVFMITGGINFFIHTQVLHGSIKGLWDNTQMRLFWALLFGGGALLFFSRLYSPTAGMHNHINTESWTVSLRESAFQIVSFITTTGYTTRTVSDPVFTVIGQQLFLVLMIIGGCSGSTSGGFKIIRIAVLFKLVNQRLVKINSGPYHRVPLHIDGVIVPPEEIRRIIVIFFVWLCIAVIGGMVTALFSNLSAWESFSGMFSAIGNIGPTFIDQTDFIALHPIVKYTLCFGMLAGRLELLPVLLILNRQFYR